MKNLLTTIVAIHLLIGISLNAEEQDKAEMTPGMKVYKKKMRKGCRSTGLRFTKSHTQNEWDAIYSNGLLPDVAKTLCPQLDTSHLTNSDWDKIYSFVHNHSSDNSVIPEC